MKQLVKGFLKTRPMNTYRIMKKYGFVYVTISDMVLAKKLAQVCLKKKLVACANITLCQDS